MPEWLKGADCKSVGLRLRWFESIPPHQLYVVVVELLLWVSEVPGGCRITAITLASQARDEGSTPFTRSNVYSVIGYRANHSEILCA